MQNAECRIMEDFLLQGRKSALNFGNCKLLLLHKYQFKLTF